MPTNEEFERWMKIAEWRGRTVRALEDIDRELFEIKKDVKDIKRQNRKRDIKTASIAGSMTIIIMIFGYVIQNGLG